MRDGIIEVMVPHNNCFGCVSRSGTEPTVSRTKGAAGLKCELLTDKMLDPQSKIILTIKKVKYRYMLHNLGKKITQGKCPQRAISCVIPSTCNVQKVQRQKADHRGFFGARVRSNFYP